MRVNLEQRATFPFMAVIIITVCVAVYLYALNIIEPIARDSFLPSDPESRALLANGLSRTAVTLISTVFGCLFLAIPITANMYTPQLINLFVRSGTNQIVLGIYIFSAGQAVWVSRVAGHVTTPKYQLGLSFFLVLFTLILLLPYLFSVLRFLEPKTIIERVGRQTITLMGAPHKGKAANAQRRLAEGVRNLGNIVLRALDRSDRNVASAGVEALDRAAEAYLFTKDRHRQTWFSIDASHFPGFSREAIHLVNRDRIWVEMEILLQMNRAYSAALAKVPDVISAISRSHRHFALAAAERNDLGSLDLALRFFNNYLREAIKSKDIHAFYDLLYQYRLTAEKIWEPYPQRALQIGKTLQILCGFGK